MDGMIFVFDGRRGFPPQDAWGSSTDFPVDGRAVAPAPPATRLSPPPGLAPVVAPRPVWPFDATGIPDRMDQAHDGACRTAPSATPLPDWSPWAMTGDPVPSTVAPARHAAPDMAFPSWFPTGSWPVATTDHAMPFHPTVGREVPSPTTIDPALLMSPSGGISTLPAALPPPRMSAGVPWNGATSGWSAPTRPTDVVPHGSPASAPDRPTSPSGTGRRTLPRLFRPVRSLGRHYDLPDRPDGDFLRRRYGIEAADQGRIRAATGGHLTLKMLQANADALSALRLDGEALSPAQILRIALCNGAAQSIHALVECASRLRSPIVGGERLTTTDVTAILAKDGGAQAIRALVEHAGALATLDFDGARADKAALVRFAMPLGGAQTIQALVRHGAALQALCFGGAALSLGNVLTITAAHGAAQAIGAVVEQSAPLVALRFDGAALDGTDVSRIAGCMGGAGTIRWLGRHGDALCRLRLGGGALTKRNAVRLLGTPGGWAKGQRLLETAPGLEAVRARDGWLAGGTIAAAVMG